tara:strand:+ start:517 stop:984 length:468 start_codon:yes stop_codon:yes gene_type:complete
MAMNLSGFVRRKTEVLLGTEKFTFTELSLADLAEYRAELDKEREQLNARRREQLIETASKLNEIDSFELLKYIDRPLTDQEFDEQLDAVNIKGIASLAYLSLKHHHPEISREQVEMIITPNPEDIKVISEAMLPQDSQEAEKKTEATAETTSELT